MLKLLFALLLIALPSATPSAQPLSAGQVCAKVGNDDAVKPYIPALEKQFSAAFSEKGEVLNAAELKTGRYRCMDGRLYGCIVGANLPCSKLNTDVKNEGAASYCKDNPSATSVPMVATGHDTVYEYACIAGRARVQSTIYKLDHRGFARDLWKPLN